MADESHFRLRIPADMKAKIEEAAKASGRSINAQVLFSIEMALAQGDEIEELKEQAKIQEENINALWRRVDDIESTLGHWQHYGAPSGR